MVGQNVFLIFVIIVAIALMFLLIKPLLTTTTIDPALKRGLDASGARPVSGFNNIEKADNTLVFDSKEKILSNFEKFLEIYYPLININILNAKLKDYATTYKNEIPTGATIGTLQETITANDFKLIDINMMINNIGIGSIISTLGDKNINSLTWLGIIVLFKSYEDAGNLELLYEYEDNQLYVYIYNKNIEPTKLKEEIDNLKDNKVDTYDKYNEMYKKQMQISQDNIDIVAKLNTQFASLILAITALLNVNSRADSGKRIGILFKRTDKDDIINKLKQSLNEKDNQDKIFNMIYMNIVYTILLKIANVNIFEREKITVGYTTLTDYAKEFQTMTFE